MARDPHEPLHGVLRAALTGGEDDVRRSLEKLENRELGRLANVLHTLDQMTATEFTRRRR